MERVIGKKIKDRTVNQIGTTVYDPPDLKSSIYSQEDEDDEEVIEDQKRREEQLKAELEGAFDDWSEDEGQNDSRPQSRYSDEGEDDNFKKVVYSDHGSHHPNGLMFRNLSDISERSMNKTQNGSCLSDVSKESGAGDSLLSQRRGFTTNRGSSFYDLSNGSNPNMLPEIGGRGDADGYQQMFFQTNSNSKNNESFKTAFSINQQTEHDNVNSFNENYRQAGNSVDQYRVLNEVRLLEIKRLTNELDIERANMLKHKQELSRKFALLEAEKERALLSRNEANKLLVANKEEVSKLQKEVVSLKDTVSVLEKEKTKSEELAEFSKLQIQELEERIALMERCDPSKIIVKQKDIQVKELTNQHQEEVHQLQRNIESLTKKLSKKEDVCSQLEQKVQDLQKAKELLLIDKSDTINQLARGLEESQAQCHQLMAANVSCENVRLQGQLEDALREKQELTETVKNLQVECTMMKSDLAQYESVSRLTLPLSSSSDDTDSVVQMGLHSHSTGTRSSGHLHSLTHTDVVAKLKEELHRALISQKSKRAEIHRLQDLVGSKEKQITEMKSKEMVFLAEFESLKEQSHTLMKELNICQEKSKVDKPSLAKDQPEKVLSLSAELAEAKKEIAVLENGKIELQKKIEHLTKHFDEIKQKEVADFNKEYLNFHDETIAKVKKELKDEAELKIKEYSLRLDQSLQEASELKEMYVAVCGTKEQLTQSLSAASVQLRDITEERDRLVTELKEATALRDQLAKKLNDTFAVRGPEVAAQRLAEVEDKLKEELSECQEERNQLASMIESVKKEKVQLSEEVERLRKLMNSSPNSQEHELTEECERLRGECTAMSARHTQELSTARAELQAARDRVLQLEKTTRLQFETEIRILTQDRDMLKAKCNEKEVQIKKLIDSRKRPPPTTTVSTQTDLSGEVVLDLYHLEERHCRELQRCKEEYSNTLAEREEFHHGALMVANSKIREETEHLQQKHQQVLETIYQRVRQQEALLKAAHEAELGDVEERTKQQVVKFFAEEVKKLAARFEASQKSGLPAVETLHKALVEKTEEIETLKNRLVVLGEECRQQVATLQTQMRSDMGNVTQLILQREKELQNVQGELKLKEAIIEDQCEKIQKAKILAKKYRNKLIKTNQEVTNQYLNKCNEYKAELQKNIDESEKEVIAKLQQIEKYYQDREKDIKRKMSNKNHDT